MSLNNLAVQLGELGRREEALAAIQEAVTIGRELAAARPDAFRPRLANSLNNLAVQLGELGRPEEALAAIQEAVTIGRELAARWPDAYQHELEQSLRVVTWLGLGEDLSDASPREPKGVITVRYHCYGRRLGTPLSQWAGPGPGRTSVRLIRLSTAGVAGASGLTIPCPGAWLMKPSPPSCGRGREDRLGEQCLTLPGVRVEVLSNDRRWRAAVEGT